jgi:hypothetical protein
LHEKRYVENNLVRGFPTHTTKAALYGSVSEKGKEKEKEEEVEPANSVRKLLKVQQKANTEAQDFASRNQTSSPMFSRQMTESVGSKPSLSRIFAAAEEEGRRRAKATKQEERKSTTPPTQLPPSRETRGKKKVQGWVVGPKPSLSREFAAAEEEGRRRAKVRGRKGKV